jgi:hypothetical protein
MPSSLNDLQDRGQDQQRHQVHHLDQRVDRRAGGVLERIADGVADHDRLVHVGALAAVVAFLDVLLGVVPRPAGVGQEVRHQLTDDDGGDQVAAERVRAEAEPNGHRHEHGEQGRRGELAERSAGADVDDRAVVGLLGVVHDPGLLAELATNLFHDHAGGAAHREDRERARRGTRLRRR